MNYLETNNTFDSIKHINELGNEFWYARELQKALNYTQWRRFNDVIEKAKVACKNSNNSILNHFANVGKMVKIGSKTMRKIDEEILREYTLL